MSDFKIGARVVIVDDHEDNHPPVVGELGTIVGKSTRQNWVINLDFDKDFSYDASEDELMVLKYAVGDRVRLVQDFDNEGSLEIGALGTVAKLAPFNHQSDYEVHWDGLPTYDSSLVQQEELGAPLTLGVGDRVRVVQNNFSDVEVGKVGTIIPKPEGRFGIFDHYVEFEDSDWIIGFVQGDLERVEESFTDIPLIGVIEISIEEPEPETYGDLLEKMVIRSKIAVEEVQGDDPRANHLRSALQDLPGLILANDGAEDIVWTLFE